MYDIQVAVVEGHLEDAWARFNGITDQADESLMSVARGASVWRS
jgi:hypothetical protein